MNPPTIKVICPACRMSGAWFATPWGPFCSQRCKLIDLGKWLGGEHVISEPLHLDDLEEYASLPTNEHAEESGAGGY